MRTASRLSCVRCQQTYPLSARRFRCECGGLLDVLHDLGALPTAAKLKREFSLRRNVPLCAADSSGVWRYRELVLPGFPEHKLVTRGEGGTRLYEFPRATRWAGAAEVLYKHEGENPTGSFKDRGMTVAMSWAKRSGAKIVACASTGNTSASVASYAALAGIPAVILISEGATALGKIAQSLAYGALTVKVRGDFDAALRLLLEAQERLGLTVLNSVNPFRLEGQKTILFEAIEHEGWVEPDWIVVPGGNLGNASAFGKALWEARQLGLIRTMPRLAVVQAAGADPFHRSFLSGWKDRPTVSARTIATAIRIGDPVNFEKAVRAIRWTDGVVTSVTDPEIMEAKAVLDSDGVGAEPASCATLAGLRRLVAEKVIGRRQRVLAVLTGHFLKDPDATVGYHAGTLSGIDSPRANAPVTIDPTTQALERVLAARKP